MGHVIEPLVYGTEHRPLAVRRRDLGDLLDLAVGPCRSSDRNAAHALPRRSRSPCGTPRIPRRAARRQARIDAGRKPLSAHARWRPRRSARIGRSAPQGSLAHLLLRRGRGAGPATGRERRQTRRDDSPSDRTGQGCGAVARSGSEQPRRRGAGRDRHRRQSGRSSRTAKSRRSGTPPCPISRRSRAASRRSGRRMGRSFASQVADLSTRPSPTCSHSFSANMDSARASCLTRSSGARRLSISTPPASR